MNTFLYAACSAAATLLLSLDAVAQSASPPAAPVVTMSPQLKYLRFEWEPVAGASYYQLFERLGNSAYTPISGQLPASITKARKYMSVHREDWANTRYQVQACNAAGCTGSESLDAQPLMLDIIGYFKASNSEAGDQFGREAVISDDGLTLAVTAQNESSSASGVNGDQEDNSSGQSGAVYIFKGNGSVWRQEAYLKMPSNRAGAFFGSDIPFLNQRAVALSRNGSVAAIGAPPVSIGFGRQGLVFVYERATTGWRHTATITSPEPQTGDNFGYSVELSLDGRTLKVNSLSPRVDDENEARTHIFQRVGSTWQHETTLAPYHAGDYCQVVRMSGDGLTLVANCFSSSQIFRAVTYKRVGGTWVYAGDLYLTRYNSTRQLALNNDGTVLALMLNQGSTSGVGFYRWNGMAWVSEQFITKPVPGSDGGGFGETLAFDRAGNQLAIGDPYSLADGAGVSNTPTPGNARHGAVYLYRRSSAATSPWRLRTVVKAPNPGDDLFGFSISLSGSGGTLAVGADHEDSNARGVDGDRLDESAPDAGAAYLY